jgi:hypothetical protein
MHRRKCENDIKEGCKEVGGWVVLLWVGVNKCNCLLGSSVEQICGKREEKNKDKKKMKEKRWMEVVARLWRHTKLGNKSVRRGSFFYCLVQVHLMCGRFRPAVMAVGSGRTRPSGDTNGHKQEHDSCLNTSPTASHFRYPKCACHRSTGSVLSQTQRGDAIRSPKPEVSDAHSPSEVSVSKMKVATTTNDTLRLTITQFTDILPRII